MRRPRLSVVQLSRLFFCLVLTFISCKAYFHPGVPDTHDGENHLARFANYKIAIREGQFPPRFAPNLYHRLGYPVFNYNYPLANLVSLPFSVAKIPYHFTFKIIMFSSVFVAIYATWLWLTKLGVPFWGRVVASTSFAASPYLFQSIIFRGNVGEVMALSLILCWLLWVEYSSDRKAVIEQRSLLSRIFSLESVLGGSILGAFFLSHNVTVLFATPLILGWSLWRQRSTQDGLLRTITALLFGLGLSVWFWIPALAEQSSIVVGGSALAQQYAQHFPTFRQLVSSSIQFGYSYVGSVDSLSFALGLTQLGAIGCSIGLVIADRLGKKHRHTKDQSTFLIFFIATILLTLLQTTVTHSLWQTTPLVRFIQFPWRLGLLALIANTFLVGYVFQRNIAWQKYLLVLLVVIQTVILLRLAPVGYINKPSLHYDLFEQSTTTSNENLARNFTFSELGDWQPVPTVLSGQAEINVLSWNGSRRSYQAIVSSPALIAEPTMNFPGWQTTIESNSTSQPVSYEDDQLIGGRIAYRLEPGTFTVHSQFTQWTWPRVLGNALSFLTFATALCTVASLFFAQRREKHDS